jgi:hypothetical protein
LDGLGEGCDEHILPKTVVIQNRAHPKRFSKVYAFVRQSNAPVERIILDDVLGRKILSKIISYFL